MDEKHKQIIIGLLLAATTLLIYWQVQDFDFVNYDDQVYVTENLHVQRGLTVENIKWAFTAKEAGFWHPLTWLSLMLDYQLFKLNPAGYHWTNLLFHLANTLLLFLVLQRMTGTLWRSGFVAALFALHPLHVESAAWIAERKDVLSAFFWMATMGAYAFYVERPGLGRYLAIILLFAFGLMAKPMLVTLPFVFLLLDYWPLRRFKMTAADIKDKSFIILIVEKIPLFVMVLVASILVYSTQLKASALTTFDNLPMGARIGNAIVSYFTYLSKMIIPVDLTSFYPHPEQFSMWHVMSSLTVILLISAFSLRYVKRFPYMAVGWFWFLGALMPVIGLVQVGAYAMADRFTYLPLVGMFIFVIWGGYDALRDLKYGKIVLSSMSILVLLLMSIISWHQISHWQNSVSLFRHMVLVTDNNYFAYNGLGNALWQKGQYTEAADNYLKSLKIKPDYAEAHNNLGILWMTLGDISKAEYQFREAIRFKKDYALAYNNMGTVYIRQGKLSEAIDCFAMSIKINPEFVEAYNNMGIVLTKEGKLDDAVGIFKRVISMSAGNIDAYLNLGNALLQKGQISDAVHQLEKALAIDPRNAKIHNNMGIIQVYLGKEEKALKHFNSALEISPNYNDAKYNKAVLMENIKSKKSGK
jgi:protein O-mannosyl-transferase